MNMPKGNGVRKTTNKQTNNNSKKSKIYQNLKKLSCCHYTYRYIRKFYKKKYIRDHNGNKCFHIIVIFLLLVYMPWFLFLCLCNFICSFMLFSYHVCTLCQRNLLSFCNIFFCSVYMSVARSTADREVRASNGLTWISLSTKNESPRRHSTKVWNGTRRWYPNNQETANTMTCLMRNNVERRIIKMGSRGPWFESFTGLRWISLGSEAPLDQGVNPESTVFVQVWYSLAQ